MAAKRSREKSFMATNIDQFFQPPQCEKPFGAARHACFTRAAPRTSKFTGSRASAPTEPQGSLLGLHASSKYAVAIRDYDEALASRFALSDRDGRIGFHATVDDSPRAAENRHPGLLWQAVHVHSPTGAIGTGRDAFASRSVNDAFADIFQRHRPSPVYRLGRKPRNKVSVIVTEARKLRAIAGGDDLFASLS